MGVRKIWIFTQDLQSLPEMYDIQFCMLISCSHRESSNSPKSISYRNNQWFTFQNTRNTDVYLALQCKSTKTIYITQFSVVIN